MPKFTAMSSPVWNSGVPKIGLMRGPNGDEIGPVTGQGIFLLAQPKLWLIWRARSMVVMLDDSPASFAIAWRYVALAASTSDSSARSSATAAASDWLAWVTPARREVILAVSASTTALAA